MIRIPIEVVRSVREGARSDNGTPAVLAFEFDDGTFEAYGRDAHWFYTMYDKEVTSDHFDDDSRTSVYRVSSAVGHARAAQVSANPLAKAGVIVLNGDDLLREYAKT